MSLFIRRVKTNARTRAKLVEIVNTRISVQADNNLLDGRRRRIITSSIKLSSPFSPDPRCCLIPSTSHPLSSLGSLRGSHPLECPLERCDWMALIRSLDLWRTYTQCSAESGPRISGSASGHNLRRGPFYSTKQNIHHRFPLRGRFRRVGRQKRDSKEWINI